MLEGIYVRFYMKEPFPLTLIVVTYNSPIYLSLTLKSIGTQSVMPDEIVIADDGSTGETKEVADRFREEMKIRFSGKISVKHIWHADEGFRRTVILNKAVAAASGEYLIQIDGDVILHPDFIKDHRRAAQEGAYIAGSRVNIQQDKARQVVETGDIALSVFGGGTVNFFNGLRAPALQKAFSRYHIGSIYHARGCNLAYWKKDFLAVNGYDETMTGWGLEDTELIVRLRHAGVLPRALKMGGIMFHMYHKTASRSGVNVNEAILQHTLADKTVRCADGVSKYLE